MPIRLDRNATLVNFFSADGLKLEGRLTRAAGDRAALLCHPHPLYGGSMLTPVIMRVEQAFQEAGYTTLAFNFRGVGGSQGEYGEGRAEVADVAGGLAFLAQRLGGPPALQAIAGYSFGSYVGGSVAATDRRVHFYLGIAPPLNTYDFGVLQGAACRTALIAGSRDEYCDPNRFAALRAALSEPAWSRVLDTNHFFAAAMPELAEACREAIAWADGIGLRSKS